MKLLQHFSGTLDQTNPQKTFRVCHWDAGISSIFPVGVKIKVRFEVRTSGLDTVDVEVKELYQATGSPGQFNPGSVLRNLDRDLRNTDSIYLIDENTVPNLTQGETLWGEQGAVNLIQSPEFEMSRSDDHELTLVLSRVAADMNYSVNVFVDF